MFLFIRLEKIEYKLSSHHVAVWQNAALISCSLNMLMFLLACLPPFSLYSPFCSNYLLGQSKPDALEACVLSLSHQGGPQSHSGTSSTEFASAPVKLSHPTSSPFSSSPPAPVSPPSWPPQAHLDSQSAFSLHEGRGEVPGALHVAPQPLHLASPGNLRDLGQEPRHDVSTLTGDMQENFTYSSICKLLLPYVDTEHQ